MKLIIETYWNKVDHAQKDQFGRSKVLPEFELKDRQVYPNGGGWESREHWKKNIAVKLDDQGRAKIHLGKAWGIESYQLVYMED